MAFQKNAPFYIYSLNSCSKYVSVHNQSIDIRLLQQLNKEILTFSTNVRNK